MLRFPKKIVLFAIVLLVLGFLFFFSGKKTPLVYPEEMTGKIYSERTVEDLPNIIIINTDDLGSGDLGVYGSQAIKTPNIDDLASEGVRFTNFNSSDSVCTPSRAGLLTGRYAKRMRLDFPLQSINNNLKSTAAFKFGQAMGKMGFVDLATEEGAQGMQQSEITIAKALKTHRNYKTGMVGKWHLGDYVSDAQYNPVHYGFDYYFGVPYSNDLHPFDLFRNLERIEEEVSDLTKLTRLYTEEAIQFMESSIGEKKPFFLYFAHTYPHRPIHASENFRHKSKAGVYGDAVEEIDWSVGEILKTLEKHKLTEKTLVVFTSDNGPWYDGAVMALRGRKGQTFEGGYRVPFIARYPDHIKAGSVCEEPAMNIDLFPTIMSLVGLSLPEDRIVDGKDITGLLTGSGDYDSDRFLYYYHQGVLEAVRWGDWKYFDSVHDYVWPVPVNKKLGLLSEHTTGASPLLFNLKEDPSESYNVADEHPEIVLKLSKVMEQWKKDLEENELGLIVKRKLKVAEVD